jgi:hypothetical protein
MISTLVPPARLAVIGNVVLSHTGVTRIDDLLVCVIVATAAAPGAPLPPLRDQPDWLPRVLELTRPGDQGAVLLNRGPMGGDLRETTGVYRTRVAGLAEGSGYLLCTPVFGVIEEHT